MFFVKVGMNGLGRRVYREAVLKRRTGKDTILLRNLWMSIAAGVIAGLATLPSASAAHGNFAKGFGAAVGHGFRSPSHAGRHGHPIHAHRAYHAPRFGYGYIRPYLPYSYYRHPNRSGFYWPRQNTYPAEVPSQGRIYVVPSPNRASSYPGYPVRRTIVINPSPYQEAGSAILNRPQDSESQEDSIQTEDFDLNIPAPPPTAPDVDASGAWEQLQDGRAEEALAAFSTWALAEPEDMNHKLGYGLAAAIIGDKLTASYALRLVYRDRGYVMKGPLHAGLNGTLARLIERYDDGLARMKEPADETFLAAAFCHLSDRPEQGLRILAETKTEELPESSPELKHLRQALQALARPRNSEVTTAPAATR